MVPSSCGTIVVVDATMKLSCTYEEEVCDMTYVIAEPCIDVKDKACVEVCPVDCIHGTDDDRQLYINPAECIDCGACEPECPVEAILPEDASPESWAPFVKINYAYTEGVPAVAKLVDEYCEELKVTPDPNIT